MRWTRSPEAGAYRRSLAAVATLALVIRLLHVTSLHYLPVSDMAGYLDNARALATGKGIHWTTLFPPGTMWFLWLLGKFFDLVVPLPVLLTQAILDTVSVVLVADVARRLFNKQTALLSALIYAVFRTAILSTGVVMSETLGTFAALCAIDLFLVYMIRRRLWLLLIVTVLTSWTVYIRVNALPMPFIFVIWMALSATRLHKSPVANRRQTIMHSAIFLTLTLLLFVPWCIRNTKVVGHPSFISNNGPMNLLMGNNVSTPGGWFTLPQIQDKEVQKALKAHDEPEQGRIARRFIISHPIYELFFLLPARLEGLFITGQNFWPWDQDAPSNYSSNPFGPYITIPLLPFAPVFYFGLFGFWYRGRKNRARLIPLLWLGFLAPLLIIFPDARFHYPSDFLLIIAAAAVVAHALPEPELTTRFRQCYGGIILAGALMSLVQCARFGGPDKLKSPTVNFLSDSGREMAAMNFVHDSRNEKSPRFSEPLVQLPVHAGWESHLLISADVKIQTTQTLNVTPLINFDFYNDEGATITTPLEAKSLLPVRVLPVPNLSKFQTMRRIVLVPAGAAILKLTSEQNFPARVEIKRLKINGPVW